MICSNCNKDVPKTFTSVVVSMYLDENVCAQCTYSILERKRSLIFDPIMIQNNIFPEERILFEEIKQYLGKHPEEGLE